jgi:DNA-binding NarL/FixJ family response regulator
MPAAHLRVAGITANSAESTTTVLHVEDDDAFAAMVETVIATEQRTAIIGRDRDGAEAVHLARTLRPDVVLMDIELPVLDGVEATARILAEQPTARIIALSGSDYTERALEACAAGAHDFIRKSGIHAELIPAILAARDDGRTGTR